MRTDLKSFKYPFNNPYFMEEKFPLRWDMHRHEKYTFYSILAEYKPEVAIEVGTFDGGSLQVLSHFSKKIYALDLNFRLSEENKKKFKNVTYIEGDSHKELPIILEKISKQNKKLQFILIDGDHTSKGVREEVENSIQYQPENYTFIILHDSFNPECHSGMLKAKWESSPFVHYVEIDFVPGNIFGSVIDGNKSMKKRMWGGLALAVLKNKKRDFKLEIRESLSYLYKSAYKNSRYKKLFFLK